MTCSFTATVSGNAGDLHRNVATVTGQDEDHRPVTDNDFAEVEITDIVPSIKVTKTADPVTLPEPGPVEFTVEVENTSVSSDPVTTPRSSTIPTARVRPSRSTWTARAL